MIYFSKLFTASAKPSPLFVSKSTLKIVLPLSCALSILGCDSHSSSPTSPITDKQATASTDTYQPSLAHQRQPASDSPSDLTGQTEGESLIAAAKSNKEPLVSSVDDSTLVNDEGMQATLIGDYAGVLPCEFCDGTQVLLNLFADGVVIKTSIYNNPQKPTAALTKSGIYRQDNDTITIVYDDQHIENYLIENNHLVLLDEDNIADINYTLSRK